MSKPDPFTDFGYERVATQDKVKRVHQVFESVATSYDLMNDFMSFGIHRVWKKICIEIAQFRPGMQVLDLAGGTGDLACKIAKQVTPNGQVFLADINTHMLKVGQQRLLDRGIWPNVRPIQANAEKLCFQNNQFDRIIIGFGLRNVTDKLAALKEMYRILKPGGKLLVLEFSEPTSPLFKKVYDVYSFKVLPFLGKHVAKDEESYRYLAESIRMHPNQDALKKLILEAGFEQCNYFNLSNGITAIHVGVKF